ncbi:MAG: 3-phosphoshikimate 1-carboxyvinyltransferase [Ignavibacteriae bacterium]|nr:3-phosphoshikimate 1-carboxyvinyltransferase [Ignavibacteriota bacterium]
MNEVPSRSIRTIETLDAEVRVPPSKSYTNRALIVASLADGITILSNTSSSDDSKYLVEALKQFGIGITNQDNLIQVEGTSGNLTAPHQEVFVGNAGTAIRFLATFSCLANGEVTLTGDEAMQKRPIKDLLDALTMAGIRSSSNNGCPPVKIQGGNFKGGVISLSANISSQFVSSILLSAPYSKYPVTLNIKNKLSSTPYVDMSLHVMRSFGAEIEVIEPYTSYYISNTERYIAEPFHIEADASAVTYFAAAAAITGGKVSVADVSLDSLQGDIRFLSVLKEMGCKIIKRENVVEIQGNGLRGIEVDMNDIPDCVPTLAVVAAFAEGETTISNVAHLQFKESNRLIALAAQLTKLGAKVKVLEDGLLIRPQPLHGATIETYNDHRIAMSFAIAGLKVPGVEILNPMCVTKSFPNFWDEFKKLEESC